MKKFLKTIIIFFSSLLCFGCVKEINSDIKHFSYNISSGLGGYREYEIEVTDKVIFRATGYMMNEINIEKEIDKSCLDELKKIINENKIYKWDGFDKSNKNVMDGSGFSLGVTYSDGKIIEAHGYMRYPKNYKIGSQALLDYFSKLEKDEI